MSSFSYSDYSSKKSSSVDDTTKKDFQKVGYFKINDGEEVIVRFDVSSPEDLLFETVHQITVNGKWTTISCPRQKNDPIDSCPLCSRGDKLFQKVFVKLLVYKTEADGSRVAVPQVWARPARFSNELVSKLNDYGDLRQVLFKVRRSGSGPSDTTYIIDYAPTQIYKQELYVADFSAFEHFDIAKHSYFVKTADELRDFIATGKFSNDVTVGVSTPQTAEPRRSTYSFDTTTTSPSVDRPSRNFNTSY